MGYKEMLKNLIYEITYDLDCDEILDHFNTLQEAGITEEILTDLGFKWFLEEVEKEKKTDDSLTFETDRGDEDDYLEEVEAYEEPSNE